MARKIYIWAGEPYRDTLGHMGDTLLETLGHTQGARALRQILGSHAGTTGGDGALGQSTGPRGQNEEP